ncbi:endo-1,4-beta-xylanase 5-like isoform X3 [Jatropha curcas]|uniref:endo-1,4-beta-xylanase 5-like isoform X3 n=1 Tax=Jatropha curcas TaxID=180498 RepID=UPI0009D6C8DC|nr:endo-1,4-beta-xylanase 5-like isoform X3 [Jatropha curcas]
MCWCSYAFFSLQCLKEPKRAQYGGGIIANPEFTDGIDSWSVFGRGAIKEGISENRNKYIIAHSRTNSLDSFSQKVHFEEGKLYSFSAWVQVKNESENVAVVFRTASGELIYGGRVIAMDGCWSLLKGGTIANFSSGPVDILFESNNTAVEIWVDNVSLQPFTMEQWRSHQDQSIHKERKSKLRFQITNSNKTTMEGAIVSIKQSKSSFPFGCGMNHFIIENKDYQKWFASRFKYTTFTNEMKWYSTEKMRGYENYTVADAMVRFAEENDIRIRGHNIFWDDPKYQPEWVKNISSDELRESAAKRINSVVPRYKGKLIAWDVMNENLHFSFFEDKLGKDASSVYFALAHQLDPGTMLFMNEYNTIENCGDEAANPVNYIRKFQEILSYPGNEKILAGIGVQGHFGSDQPNLAYMRASLDILASSGLPIWLTEVDVRRGPNQAEYMEQVLREGYSHPGVEGIIMFVGPAIAGFNVTTLADKDFKNTPSGDVVDKLIDEWKFKTTEIKPDSEGSFEVSLFHGDYDITIKDPFNNTLTNLNYKLTEHDTRDTVQIHINAF